MKNPSPQICILVSALKLTFKVWEEWTWTLHTTGWLSVCLQNTRPFLVILGWSKSKLPQWGQSIWHSKKPSHCFIIPGWECDSYKMTNILNILWRFFWDSLGILWGFFGILWRFFEDSMGILWGFFGHSFGILWGYFGDSLGILWGFFGDSFGGIFWGFFCDSLEILMDY